MGDDGHTASLWAREATAVDSTRKTGATDRLVIATISTKQPPLRVSLSLTTINNARYVAMFVGGAGKASVIATVMEQVNSRFTQRNSGNPLAEEIIDGFYPASLVGQRGSVYPVTYFVDKSAASALPK
jgi:Glucosamine-6-phosphate isomerases/6-phosphogluconolactonase